jgi:hypothetical protein
MAKIKIKTQYFDNTSRQYQVKISKDRKKKFNLDFFFNILAFSEAFLYNLSSDKTYRLKKNPLVRNKCMFSTAISPSVSIFLILYYFSKDPQI